MSFYREGLCSFISEVVSQLTIGVGHKVKANSSRFCIYCSSCFYRSCCLITACVIRNFSCIINPSINSCCMAIYSCVLFIQYKGYSSAIFIIIILFFYTCNRDYLFIIYCYINPVFRNLCPVFTIIS